MTNREKLAHFERELEERGFWKSNALPPLVRILWFLGWEVPPPYFLSFREALIGAGTVFGTLFGVLFGTIFWALGIGSAGFRLSVIGGLAISTGIAFGLSMAYFWSWQREKLELPPWEDYPVRDGVGRGE